MKILWIVNMVFPEVAQHLGLKTGVSGGWMLDLSAKIAQYQDIELAVAAVYNGKELLELDIGNIKYFLIPGGSRKMLFYSKQNEEYWRRINDRFPADIVHLHGTEYSHGLAYLRTFPHAKSLLTIQGILTRIAQECNGGLTFCDLLRFRTLKECIRLNGQIEQQILFKMNAYREKEIINKVKYVTGRTFWDYSNIRSINPNIKYYRCNYNLRSEFYSAPKWSVSEIEKHSIFTGQASTPLKGLHIILKAMDIVKKHYPDVKLYIPGGTVKDNKLLPASGYDKYVLNLISKYDLQRHIVFIGPQNASGIIERMLKSNVAIVPSTIEGASATLCEAMFLGVPCIASYRGGMTELLRDKESGFFYDFHEYSVLANRIIQLFDNNNLASTFSQRVIADATIRHDRTKNPEAMVQVYNDIIHEKEA